MSIEDQQALPQNYILEKKYKILSVIGSGAFGITYLVEHLRFSSQHVIKEYFPDTAFRDSEYFIHPVSSNDKEFFDWGLKQFIEEAKLLNKLTHPNVVKVTDVFEDYGTAYFVMPYLGKYTLYNWIKSHQSPSVDELNAIYIPLLEGLKYIHDQGLYHGDIKPENIIISDSGIATLIDFGSARQSFISKTRTMGQILTPPYAPIEQYSSRTLFAPTLDIYSLGACIYESVSSKSIPEAPDRLQNDGIEKLSTNQNYLDKYPLYFLNGVDKSLSFYDKDRQKSALEFQQDLLDYHETKQQAVKEPKDTGHSAGVSYSLKNKKINDNKAASSYHMENNDHKNGDKKTLRILAACVAVALIGSLVVFGSKFMNGNQGDCTTPDCLTAHSSSTPKSNDDTLNNIEEMSRTVNFNIQGSNTIGSSLMPKLVTDYFVHKKNYSNPKYKKDSLEYQKITFDNQLGEPFIVGVGSYGSGTGIQALSDYNADIAMSSRPIKDKEVAVLQELGKGDMKDPSQEIVIGVDGIAIIVHQSNKVKSLTKSQLKDIFSGKISDWSDVGGNTGKINLYIRNKNSGTRDTFESLVMAGEAMAKSLEFEDSNKLSSKVSSDIGGIGYIGLPYINSAKALAVSDSNETTAFLPTVFTVATEDYPLSRRLFLYLNKDASQDSRDFVRYITSEQGQRIVEESGFIKLTPELMKEKNTYHGSNDGYISLINNAERMNTTFRFAFNSSTLDNKARQDLTRVTSMIAESNKNGTRKKLVLVGFSDSRGSECINNAISYERAKLVADELQSYGVKADIITGLGSEAPVADNTTDAGREKNRRVELWLAPNTVTANFKKLPTC